MIPTRLTHLFFFCICRPILSIVGALTFMEGGVKSRGAVCVCVLGGGAASFSGGVVYYTHTHTHTRARARTHARTQILRVLLMAKRLDKGVLRVTHIYLKASR